MNRENFYILLGLDGSVSDPARIEAAIKSKQAEWSKDRNHPNRGTQAQQNLELLKLIRPTMADPVKRAAEANDAKVIRNARQKEATKDLDDNILVLSAAGSLTEPQVAELVRKFKDQFTNGQVRARIKVPIRESEVSAKPLKQIGR